METYSETQRFRQWWVWLVLGLPAVLGWMGFVIQIILGREFGNQPAPDWVVILIWVFGAFLLPLFMFRLSLETRVVAREGIHLRFRPFRGRTVPFESIESVTPGTYRPIREFGGWGVRWGGKGKRAYSVSGNERVEVILDDGTAWTIGTARPDELAAAIRRELTAGSRRG